MNKLDIRKYAIFAIVCFLSFFGYSVNAKDAAVITPGKESTLVAAMNYENAVCYVNNKQITSSSDYNDGKYHIYYDGADIKIRSTEDAVNTNLSLFCTYENYFEVVNANRVWKSGAGDLSMDISSYTMSGASEITIDMDEQFNSEYTITSWVGNMGTMQEVNLSDARLNMSGCVSGTDVCKIQLNSPIRESGQVRGTIKYRDKESGVENTLTVIINIRDTWFLKADGGNYAKTCSFDPSLWEKPYGDANIWYSKQGKDISFNNASFPSCEVDTNYNPLIEFKGWVYQKRDANINSSNAGLLNGNFQTIDYCTTVANQYPELFGFVGAGQTVDPRDIHYGYVFACYGSKGIAIDLNGGKGNLDTSIWKLYTSSDGLFSATHGYNGLYTYTNGGNITLPSEITPPAIFSNTAQFVGWKNRTTGEVLPGGTVVDGTDGTIYSAIYKQSGNSSDGGIDIEIGGYEIKTVFVNEKTEIILRNGYTCNTYSDSYFKIDNGGTVAGETRCTITGLSTTNGQFVNVPFTNENGSTYTYKIMVATRDGLGGIPVTGTPNINIQINIGALGDNKVSGTPVSASEGYGCRTFRVSTKRGTSYATPIHYRGNSNYQLSITRYGLTCNDSSYIQKEYASLCLDPGRSAPDVNDLYEYDRAIDPNTSDFHKAISYIVLRTMETKPRDGEIDGVSIASANVAARILEFVYGEDNGHNNTSSLTLHYNAYRVIADNVRNKVLDGSVTYSDLFTGPVSKTDACPSNRDCFGSAGNESAVNLVLEYLNFKNQNALEAVSQMSHPRNETKIDRTDGYKVYFSGKITLPKNSEIVTQTIGSWRGQLAILINDPNIKDAALTSYTCANDGCTYAGYINTTPTGGVLPSGKNFTLKVFYRSPYSLDNAVLLKRSNSQKLTQRFIAFNDELESYFYLNFTNDCSTLIAAAGNDESSAMMAVNAGCCTTEVEKSNPTFYNRYCRKNCVYDETYKLEDGSNDFICTNKAQDLNSIKEATSNMNEGNYACIVDISKNTGSVPSLNYSQALTATENMTDFRGNNLSVGEYNSVNGVAGTGNPYCRVTCKEDWTFNTPGFSNFTGVNAVKAGSYFTINGKMSISSTKTCVTTYINIDGYKENVDSLTKNITDNTNEYLGRAQAMSNRNIKDATPETYYKEYRRTGADRHMEACTESTKNKEGCYTTIEGTYQNASGIYVTCTNQSDLTKPGCREVVHGSYQDGWDVHYEAAPLSCTRKILYVNSGVSYPRYDYVTGSSTSLAIGRTNEVYSPFNAGTQTKTERCSDETCSNDRNINMDAGGVCVTYTNKEEAIAALTPGLTYNDANLVDTMRNLSNRINTLKTQLDVEATNFGKCQNFYLYNNRNINTSSNQVYGGTYIYEPSSADANLSSTGSVVKITDFFDPVIKYKYDEETYMSYIGDGNRYILDQFEGGTNTTSYYDTITDMTNYTGTSSGNNRRSVVRTLCTVPNNYAGNYENNSMYCKQVHFYYYDAHYIKNSLTQSGTFKNNVTWFQRQYGNIIYPGSGGTLQERLDTAKRNSGNPGDSTPWTRLGENDVFPVQLNTRRNVYQYVFTFENIGTFMSGDKKHSDTDLGRIMGSSTSIAMYNFNTCFYEVYEGMCLCCGRTMSSTARVENDTKVNTTDHVPNTGANYSNNTTNSVKLNANGTLGFYTNSVSLSDLAGAASGFDKNSNWGSEDEYFYNGQIYHTNKGSSLVDAIQNKGDTIYGTTPEYSYTLNPSALSAIKNMEHSTKYVVQTGDLTAVGSYMIKGGSASTDGANNVLLTHFKSNFLDKIKEYETAEYKALLFTNKDMHDKCRVTDAKDVTNSSYSDCRWIDYMDDDGFRLAFK